MGNIKSLILRVDRTILALKNPNLYDPLEEKIDSLMQKSIEKELHPDAGFLKQKKQSTIESYVRGGAERGGDASIWKKPLQFSGKLKTSYKTNITNAIQQVIVSIKNPMPYAQVLHKGGIANFWGKQRKITERGVAPKTATGRIGRNIRMMLSAYIRAVIRINMLKL